MVVGETRKNQKKLIEQFKSLGLSEEVIQRFAVSRVMYAGLNIIEVSTLNSFDIVKTAQVYFACGSAFHLFWFRDYLAKDTREGLWNSLARLTLRDELDNIQRRLTVLIMNTFKDELATKELIINWIKMHHLLYTRWEDVFAQIQEAQNYDYTIFFIAFRELNNLLDGEMHLAHNQQDEALVSPRTSHLDRTSHLIETV